MDKDARPEGGSTSGAGPDPEIYCRWARGLVALICASARLERFRATEEALPPEKRAFPAGDALEEQFDRLEITDLPALALKIELFIDEAIWEFPRAQPCIDTLKTDARRLLAASA